MKDFVISINPLAEFIEASDNRKKTIVAEQLNPDPVRIPYYQRAKSSIAKTIMDNGNQKYIVEAKELLLQKVPLKKWQKSDKVNSLVVLELWEKMILPDFINKKRLEPVKTKAKFLPLYGIQIKVSPTRIFRIEHHGKRYIGAFKLHFSKNKAFNNKQSALVAQLLNQFLSNFVAEEDEIVHPQLCLCIDPFSGSVITAANKMKYDMKQLKNACIEIHAIWNGEGQNRNSEVA